jgi:hypothetical protein
MNIFTISELPEQFQFTTLIQVCATAINNIFDKGQSDGNLIISVIKLNH